MVTVQGKWNQRSLESQFQEKLYETNGGDDPFPAAPSSGNGVSVNAHRAAHFRSH